ncbi:ABC transporter ATP-binding protein [Agrococcus jenensis]|uniref:Amino acid/amide ABC transporter ATP-binding protein 2 (HAAT family) n=1 Tax=Agrococcus jenensis TaxID=46353 RepID=A0A3N2ATV9_9MICO|nr:ABC transporter ATP-binding protein [Agrococcus jenensis]ROR66358.1 amino acid/amide ABC transporter ATP-binding protein 2 (HAAT family) [Agrococcus jenensis]
MSAILTVRGLDAHIGGQQVVEDVSFDVAEHGVTALLGRNGVGKSSTIKALLGLTERTGEVTFAGQRIDGLLTHRIVQRGIAYVPEDREVFGGLTVEENLRLAERGGAPNRAIVAELFPELIERAKQQAGTLSGGQQQMVSLSRALMNENRLLLVDEPTKGLAPLIVGTVTTALEAAADRTPMLLVEQNLQVVRALAHTVVVLSGGRVVHTGPAAEFLDSDLVHRHLGVATDQEAA